MKNRSPSADLPCAACLICPLWPLAHIQGRSCGATGTLKMPNHDAVLQYGVVPLVVADRRALEDQRGHFGSGGGFGLSREHATNPAPPRPPPPLAGWNAT